MKLVTWNIQSGGGKRIVDICNSITEFDCDFIALTEFRNTNEHLISACLEEKGLIFQQSAFPDKNENGVYIASRYAFEIIDAGDFIDTQRWISIYLPDLDCNILSVHVPGATDSKFDANGYGISGDKRKEIFWQKIIDYAVQNKNKTIMLGDFNTGLLQDAQGTPFKLSKYMQQLLDLGFIDTWRYLNAEISDYTWYWKRRNKENGTSSDYNGFRLDYVYASPDLKSSIKNVNHIHHVRENKISDHSAIVCELDL
jgi:exodeoxyribonuclease-3